MEKKAKLILTALAVIAVAIAAFAVMYPTLFPALKETIKLGVIASLTGSAGLCK